MKYRIVIEKDDQLRPIYYPEEIVLPKGILPPKNLYFKPVEANVTIDIYGEKSKRTPFASYYETLGITKEENLNLKKGWFRSIHFTKEEKKKLRKSTRIRITIDSFTYKPTTKKDLVDGPTKNYWYWN